MGYSGIELAGTGGLSAAEMCDLLAETGLKVAGSHVMVNLFQEQLDELITYYSAIGAKYVGIPALPGELRTVEGFKTVARLMNSAGKTMQDAGLALYYHNHAFEFDDLGGGVRGMDILWNETDPAVAFFEIDCYWAVHAGIAHRSRRMGATTDPQDMARARTFAGSARARSTGNRCLPPAKTGGRLAIVEQDRCARRRSKAPS